MNNVVAFNFESNEVRTLTDERDDSVWFVLRDVLNAMGRKGTRTNEAKASIEAGLGDGYVKTVSIVDSLGRNQKAAIVNDAATTFLISRSNTEVGKKLNRWIHSEVIPAIRKTGGYQVPMIDFTDSILMAQLLNQQATLYLEAQAKVDQMTPKVEVYDKVMSSSSLNSMKDTADLINRKGLGRNNLLKLLRDRGIINSNNKPYRKYIELGYMEVKERVYEAATEMRVGYTPYTTQKGLAWLERNINDWME